MKMTTAHALAELGAGPDTLTDAERAQLDEAGYVIFPALLDEATLAQVRARLDELERPDSVNAADGASRVDFLHHRGPLFDRLWQEPRLLASVAHCLGDFRLTMMTTRTTLPGRGHQAMHVDWWYGDCAPEFLACNSTWMIDDFTAENGPTRIVPGSHRWRTRPEDAMADPNAAHPDEIRVEGPAGSLVVFNGYTWHSGTRNGSDLPRRGIFSTFGRRDQPWEAGPETSVVDPATRARLSPSALYLLDALSRHEQPPRAEAA